MNPLRTLLGGVADLLHARLGLLATEGREELARFALLVLAGCAAILLAALGLAAGSAAVIIAAGEAYRLAAASVLAVLYAAGTACGVMRVRSALAAKPAAFGASLAELAADRAALVERSRENRSALADSGNEIVRLVEIGMIAYSIGRSLRRTH